MALLLAVSIKWINWQKKCFSRIQDGVPLKMRHKAKHRNPNFNHSLFLPDNTFKVTLALDFESLFFS
jgi:hypothetical protein